MFTVTAKSCQNPSITYERDDVASILGATRMANALYKGFRSVEVMDNETGEICLTKYASDSFYAHTLDWASAIDHAEDEFYYESHLDEREDDPIQIIP
jgi:hypothetical protein